MAVTKIQLLIVTLVDFLCQSIRIQCRIYEATHFHTESCISLFNFTYTYTTYRLCLRFTPNLLLKRIKKNTLTRIIVVFCQAIKCCEIVSLRVVALTVSFS